MIVVCSNWMCGSVIPERGNVIQGENDDDRFFVCPRCRALSRMASVWHDRNDPVDEARASVPIVLPHS